MSFYDISIWYSISDNNSNDFIWIYCCCCLIELRSSLRTLGIIQIFVFLSLNCCLLQFFMFLRPSSLKYSRWLRLPHSRLGQMIINSLWLSLFFRFARKNSQFILFFSHLIVFLHREASSLWPNYRFLLTLSYEVFSFSLSFSLNKRRLAAVSNNLIDK